MADTEVHFSIVIFFISITVLWWDDF